MFLCDTDNILLPPAPPAYDEIIQYPTTGGQLYNSDSSIQQQPLAITNVSHAYISVSGIMHAPGRIDCESLVLIITFLVHQEYNS